MEKGQQRLLQFPFTVIGADAGRLRIFQGVEHPNIFHGLIVRSQQAARFALHLSPHGGWRIAFLDPPGMVEHVHDGKIGDALGMVVGIARQPLVAFPNGFPKIVDEAAFARPGLTPQGDDGAPPVPQTLHRLG